MNTTPTITDHSQHWLITGPAGSGKTRAANALTALVAAAGYNTNIVTVPSAEAALAAHDGRPMLAIIDTDAQGVVFDDAVRTLLDDPSVTVVAVSQTDRLEVVPADIRERFAHRLCCG